MVRQPYPVQDLQAVTLRDFRNPVLAELDRIGADTVGVFRQQREVFLDLLGLDVGACNQRILLIPERRVRDAVVFLAGRKRRWRQLHRRAKPPPCGANRERRQREQRDRRTGLISTECAAHTGRLSPHGTGCQGLPTQAFTKPAATAGQTAGLGVISASAERGRRNPDPFRWPRGDPFRFRPSWPNKISVRQPCPIIREALPPDC